MFKFGNKAKTITGLLIFYGSTETYLHFKTKSLITARKQELNKAASVASNEDDVDTSKFKSATIAGMFINPFEEYRPQTGFEFVLVRLLELVESFYGNKVELHGHPPQDIDHTVEDYLTFEKPNIEILRQNSTILHQCIEQQDFSKIYSPTKNHQTGFNFNVFTPKKSSYPALNKQLLFTWLGQSCSLIQISGINILTDPILSDHLLSPHVGPKRLKKSPMDLSQINYATNNKLDFVMVSHDHPDHLENDLINKIGNSSVWIVPLGLKSTLARKGVYNTIEMDWWDCINLNEYIDPNKKLKDQYEIIFVPSMHWSGRYVIDANFSLWGSYILKQNGKSILYHAGDTGYLKQLFDVIGKKYGPISLSLLPIGQYCPSWHQSPRHISPEESLKICQQVDGKFMMGIHWGTFKLSSEPILEPKNLLTKLSKDIQKFDNYKVPEFGLTYLYDIDKNIEYKLHN